MLFKLRTQRIEPSFRQVVFIMISCSCSSGGHENSRKSDMKHRLVSKTTSLQGILSNSSRIQNLSANGSRLLKGVVNIICSFVNVLRLNNMG